MKKQKIIFTGLITLSIAVFGLSMKKKPTTANALTVALNAPDQPEELGKVHWLRNYNEAVALAIKKDKPILILFQEVPGCLTCRNYGNNILSHPLIVEAIETLFVPLAIYNNKRGEDAKVLQSFGEPSWNNPVVRIVNNERMELAPRLGGDYSQLGIVNAMINALTVTGQVVPNYLNLLVEEFRATQGGLETATVGMYCFWTGEKEIGVFFLRQTCVKRGFVQFMRP